MIFIYLIGRKLVIFLVEFFVYGNNDVINGSFKEKVLWNKGSCYCRRFRVINFY